jgi:hypothetical protein
MARFLRVLAFAALGAAITAGAALAAGMAVQSARLTVVTSATSVPVAECVLTATADTYAAEVTPSSNFGSDTGLAARSELLANERTFVRFTIGTCGIPTGARIRSATLELTVSAAPDESRTYGVHRVSETWGEPTLAWTNQPAAAGTTATAVVDATGVAAWDVQADVAAFVAGTAANEGWMLRDQTEDAVLAHAVAFGSGESSTPPTLRITYYP